MAAGFILEIRSFGRKSAIWLGLVNEQAVGLKLGLIGFELGLYWVCFGILLALIGFVLALIGFVLGLFSPSVQLDLYS